MKANKTYLDYGHFMLWVSRFIKYFFFLNSKNPNMMKVIQHSRSQFFTMEIWTGTFLEQLIKLLMKLMWYGQNLHNSY